MKSTGLDKKYPHRSPGRTTGQDIWIKAAVAGGFWAAIEIIIGSFLHNMHLPFAGSLLTFLGVVITASFYRIWPENGLLWRAGVICALMKSVSPSAIILGPMIGILTEAVIMDLALRFMGNRLMAYITGGVLAMFSTLIHKIITLLILYGMNLVRIAENLYYFSIKQIETDRYTLWILLAFIALFYLAGGIAGGWIGCRTGNRLNMNAISSGTLKGSHDQHFLNETPAGRKYSVWLLAAYVLLIPAGLIVTSRAGLWVAALLTLCLTLLVALLYPGSVRKIRKPMFWVQFFVVIISASFFLGNIDRQDPGWSVNGLHEGVRMCLRALIVYFGFSAISNELRNPVVTRILTRRGLENLYVSLSLAFMVLPHVARKITGPRRMITRPGASLISLLNEAERWLEEIRKIKTNGSG